MVAASTVAIERPVAARVWLPTGMAGIVRLQDLTAVAAHPDPHVSRTRVIGPEILGCSPSAVMGRMWALEPYGVACLDPGKSSKDREKWRPCLWEIPSNHEIEQRVPWAAVKVIASAGQVAEVAPPWAYQRRRVLWAAITSVVVQPGVPLGYLNNLSITAAGVSNALSGIGLRLDERVIDAGLWRARQDGLLEAGSMGYSHRFIEPTRRALSTWQRAL